MLPITQHRVFHIPNSLATIAAIAAVITALSLGTADDPDMAGDLQSAKESATFSAGHADSDLPENDGKAARKAAEVQCRSCGDSGLSGLLPLVLPGNAAR